jgi:hypothetical protein
MYRRIAIAAVLASSFVATGWAQSPPTQPAPAASAPAKPAAKKAAPKAKPAAKQPAAVGTGPCQIGVITIVGNVFGVQKIGFTVFGNEYTPVPIESWGLDDLAVARVRAAAAGRVVRKIAYDKEELSRIGESKSFFRNLNDDVKQFVQRSAGNANCERYVLINRTRSRFSNLNQTVNGVGIVKWGNPIKERTYLFALTYIRVLDGQTFDIVKQSAAESDDEHAISRLLVLNPIRGPNHELDESLFPATPADAASNPAFREGIRSLLTTSLDRTLPGLLGP